MNKISLALNGVLLIAVAVLFYLYISLNNKLGGAVAEPTTSTVAPKVFTDPAKLANAKIAYVNIDSLDKKYEYINDYSKTIRGKQASIEGLMNSMVARLQQEYAEFQQSVQAGLKSEAELKKIQAQLEQQQYEIANKEKQLQGLSEEVAARQSEMLKNVSSFVAKYNSGKYDFILAYTSNIGSVLYARPDLEITKDVIEGLNAEYKITKTQKK
jgi:outer membrane protein